MSLPDLISSAWAFWGVLGGVASTIVGGVVFAVRVDRKLRGVIPAMTAIATEFADNGGTNLRGILQRLEDEVARTLAIQRMTLVTAGKACWDASPSGEFTWASDGLLDIFGRHASDLVGSNWVASVHPADALGVWEEWTRAARDGRRFASTFRVVRPDDTTVRVKAEAWALRPTRGEKVLGFFGDMEIISTEQREGRAA